MRAESSQHPAPWSYELTAAPARAGACRHPLPPAAAPTPYCAPHSTARSFLLLLTLVAAAAGVRFLVGFGMKALRGEAHVGAGGQAQAMTGRAKAGSGWHAAPASSKTDRPACPGALYHSCTSPYRFVCCRWSRPTPASLRRRRGQLRPQTTQRRPRWVGCLLRREGVLVLPCWHVSFSAQHAADGTAHAGMCSRCCCCPAPLAIQMGAHRSLHCMPPAVVAARNLAAGAF